MASTDVANRRMRVALYVTSLVLLVLAGVGYWYSLSRIDSNAEVAVRLWLVDRCGITTPLANAAVLERIAFEDIPQHLAHNYALSSEWVAHPDGASVRTQEVRHYRIETESDGVWWAAAYRIREESGWGVKAFKDQPAPDVSADPPQAEVTPESPIDEALRASAADPGNPGLHRDVGHLYYEQAVGLYESGDRQAARPYWLKAVESYDQAIAREGSDLYVLGNRAFALYYAGDARASEALRAFIDAAGGSLSSQVESAKQMLAEIE